MSAAIQPSSRQVNDKSCCYRSLTPSYRLDRGEAFEWVPDPINFCVIKFCSGKADCVKKKKPSRARAKKSNPLNSTPGVIQLFFS